MVLVSLGVRGIAIGEPPRYNMEKTNYTLQAAVQSTEYNVGVVNPILAGSSRSGTVRTVYIYIYIYIKRSTQYTIYKLAM